MLRVLKLLVLVILVVAAVAFFNGYRFPGAWGVPGSYEPTVGTSGETRDERGIDVERARERGAEVGEKAAVAVDRAKEALSDAALTTKIKSKMALDDSVSAGAISVHTTNGAVTLTGTVRSETERQRAVQLARETNGVTSVEDRLQLR